MPPHRNVSLRIRIRTKGAYRYVPVVTTANGRIKPLHALVDGKPEHHPEGVYSLRYRSDGRRIDESVGKDAQFALTAKLRREHLLRGYALGIAESSETEQASSIPEHFGAPQVAEKVAEYLAEIELRSARRTAAAYRRSLTLFQQSCDKALLNDVDRSDVLRFMSALRAQGNGARTVYNRVCALGAFLKHFGLSQVVRKKDIPRYTEKVPSAYSKRELSALFAACSPSDRLLFKFFLGTGAREQEVTYACWSDIDFDGGVFDIHQKTDMKWTLKDREERSIPLPDALLKELAQLQARSVGNRLIFPTASGRPDGHFLRRLKRIAFKAGLNCGRCVSKKGLRCAEHPVCKNWELHKMRKTFAVLHHESGTSMRTLQAWLGHADLVTTQAYLSAADVRSQKTRSQVNRTFDAFCEDATEKASAA